MVKKKMILRLPARIEGAMCLHIPGLMLVVKISRMDVSFLGLQHMTFTTYC